MRPVSTTLTPRYTINNSSAFPFSCLLGPSPRRIVIDPALRLACLLPRSMPTETRRCVILASGTSLCSPPCATIPLTTARGGYKYPPSTTRSLQACCATSPLLPSYHSFVSGLVPYDSRLYYPNHIHPPAISVTSTTPISQDVCQICSFFLRPRHLF